MKAKFFLNVLLPALVLVPQLWVKSADADELRFLCKPTVNIILFGGNHGISQASADWEIISGYIWNENQTKKAIQVRESHMFKTSDPNGVRNRQNTFVGAENQLLFDFTSIVELPLIIELSIPLYGKNVDKKLLFLLKYSSRFESHLLRPFIENPTVRQAWKSMPRPMAVPAQEAMALRVDAIKTPEDIINFVHSENGIIGDSYLAFAQVMRAFAVHLSKQPQMDGFIFDRESLVQILQKDKLENRDQIEILNFGLGARNYEIAKNIIAITCAAQEISLPVMGIFGGYHIKVPQGLTAPSIPDLLIEAARRSGVNENIVKINPPIPRQ